MSDRLRELFDRAISLPREERDAFIEQSCTGAPELAAELRELIAGDDSTHGVFLEGGTVGDGARSLTDDASGALPFDQIGAYRIIREIGRGGMGVVYEAEQERPKRRVALKVVRTGLMGERLGARFRREADVLARLQHHGIAHIYESGTARVGSEEVPFFAMEFIEGSPLDDHARRQRFSTPQKLELVARVCDAVQHAHQKGIIHRDLKPCNVLVVEERTHADESGTAIDAIGQPKILDFGIARFTDADVNATVQTNPGQIIGTLAYMSPEQVEGQAELLDTRCDVYALGVILYSLLAGHPPHDFAGVPIAEAARLIRDDDPPTLGSIDASLRGDASTIAQKAMEKDPDRRYASAGLMAEDIRRSLRDEPIAARPASTFYQLSKFARRNRALVGGIAASFALLVLGIAGTSIGLFRVAKERDAKQTALDTTRDALEASDQVTLFLTEMLGSAAPESRGRDVTVKEVVDLSARGIESRFADRPLIEARIRKTIGDTYISLGEFDEAELHLDRAVEMWGTHKHAPPIERLKARLSIADVLQYRSEYEEALAFFESVAPELSQLPRSEPVRARAITAHANVLIRLGRLDEAESLLMEQIPSTQQAVGAADLALLEMRSALAHAYSVRGADEAQALYEELIRLATDAHGDDHPATLQLIGHLAAYFRGLGRVQEAIPLVRQVHDAQLRVLGPSHRQTLISANNLAQVLAYSNQPDEARVILDDALDTALQSHGEDSSPILFLRFTLGSILSSAGELDRAEEVMLQNVASHERVQGPDAEGTYHTRFALGRLYLKRREFDSAADVFRRIMEQSTATLPDDHPRVYRPRYELAKSLHLLDRFGEAKREYLASHKYADPTWRASIERSLAKLAEHWDDPVESPRLLAALIEIHGSMDPPDHQSVAAIQHQLGDQHARHGEWAKAATAYREALAVSDEHASGTPSAPTRARLGIALAALGKLDEASDLLNTAVTDLESMPDDGARGEMTEVLADAREALAGIGEETTASPEHE